MWEVNTTFAVIASVLALVTALAALAQAFATAASNRARFFVEFSKRYTDDEMRAALETLAQWHHDNKHDENRFALWAAAKRRGETAATGLNRSRRLVSRYYYDVASLHQLRLVGTDFAKALISNNGLNIFYQICDPMNRTNQPLHRFKQQCDTLKRLRKQFGDGTIFEPNEPREASRSDIWTLISGRLHRRQS